MEMWDLYTMNREKTGETLRRGDEMPPERYHLVVHVVVFNSRGEMLIQQRQPFKEGWPNLWDITVGGSAVMGDTSQTAAMRETQEELGLHLALENERPRLTIHFSQGFDDIYVVTQDVDLSTLTLQPSEVQAVKWATEEEILRMVADGTFIPYLPGMISLLFHLRTHRGTHTV